LVFVMVKCRVLFEVRA